jgi:hypothetical protein
MAGREESKDWSGGLGPDESVGIAFRAPADIDLRAQQGYDGNRRCRKFMCRRKRKPQYKCF